MIRNRAEAEAHQRRLAAKGHIKLPDYLNPDATLEEMELILEAQKRTGEILEHRFEGIRLKWGVDPKTGAAMWYKPDFVVSALTDMKLIEVKGPWISERDVVRFKGCRAAWPQFQFEMHQRNKEGWWARIQ